MSERTQWQQYKRKGISEMRPYVPGEDLSGISVSNQDTPEAGGMIARNPDNHDDQWYVARGYFAKNFALVEAGISFDADERRLIESCEAYEAREQRLAYSKPYAVDDPPLPNRDLMLLVAKLSRAADLAGNLMHVAADPAGEGDDAHTK